MHFSRFSIIWTKDYLYNRWGTSTAEKDIPRRHCNDCSPLNTRLCVLALRNFWRSLTSNEFFVTSLSITKRTPVFRAFFFLWMSRSGGVYLLRIFNLVHQNRSPVGENVAIKDLSMLLATVFVRFPQNLHSFWNVSDMSVWHSGCLATKHTSQVILLCAAEIWTSKHFFFVRQLLSGLIDFSNKISRFSALFFSVVATHSFSSNFEKKGCLNIDHDDLRDNQTGPLTIFDDPFIVAHFPTTTRRTSFFHFAYSPLRESSAIMFVLKLVNFN